MENVIQLSEAGVGPPNSDSINELRTTLWLSIFSAGDVLDAVSISADIRKFPRRQLGLYMYLCDREPRRLAWCRARYVGSSSVAKRLMQHSRGSQRPATVKGHLNHFDCPPAQKPVQFGRAGNGGALSRDGLSEVVKLTIPYFYANECRTSYCTNTQRGRLILTRAPGGAERHAGERRADLARQSRPVCRRSFRRCVKSTFSSPRHLVSITVWLRRYYWGRRLSFLTTPPPPLLSLAAFSRRARLSCSSRPPGHKHLPPGNHDSSSRRKPSPFCSSRWREVLLLHHKVAPPELDVRPCHDCILPKRVDRPLREGRGPAGN